MWALISIISLLPIFSLFQEYKHDWRQSWLFSLMVWGVCLTLITELLSIFHLLTFEWLILLWLTVTLSGLLIYFRIYGYKAFIQRLTYYLKQISIFKLSWSEIILLVGVTLIISVVGFLAIVTAPNNWDSMIYHMSRVPHWIQNQNVAHYPTHTLKQIYQNPWAEFVIMHLQILSGGDRLANLVQWAAMINSLVGISLISQELGAKIRGQILAVVFCATIPMGILQASSTQNDYVVSFWLVCFVYFVLLTVKRDANLSNVLGLAISLGLAILTKGIAYIYAFPFCLWVGIWGLKNLRLQIWKPVLIVSLVVLGINLGHYTRNFFVFDSPLGGADETIEIGLSWQVLVSNFTRNLAYHADIVRNLWLDKFIVPTTGITAKLIEIIHEYIGLDVSDPRTTSPLGTKFYVPGLSFHEDTAGNPLHLLLIFISFCIFIFNKRINKNHYLWLYFLSTVGGFIMFCLLLTWSPWRCRLHLPLFILLGGFWGTVFSKSFNTKATTILAIFLICIAQPWVFNNKLKPLMGEANILHQPRIEHYFFSKPYIKPNYLQAVKIIDEQKCSQIGLTGSNVFYEYPLWVLLEQNQKPFIFKHILVNNISSKINETQLKDGFNPCVIIGVNSSKKSDNSTANLDKLVMNNNEVYRLFWSEGLVQIFVREQN